MRKLFTLVVCCMFFVNAVYIMPACADGNAWDDVDLNYKTSKDSVDWGEIDLVSKPPKTPQTDPEQPGEKIGLTGPIIAFGGKGKDEALVVYDACGTPTTVITQDEAKADPKAAEDKLESACAGTTNEALTTYFSGQVLTGSDLNALTDYVVGKNRLHSRALFGEGVVCGLDVQTAPVETGKVTVDSGYALDTAGNDVLMPSDTVGVSINTPAAPAPMAPSKGLIEGQSSSDMLLPSSSPVVDARPMEGTPQAQVDGASTGIDVGQNAIEEVQVNSSGIAAEYGRSVGGVINTVTRQGGAAYGSQANVQTPAVNFSGINFEGSDGNQGDGLSLNPVASESIAPRVGLTYDISGGGKPAIRTTFQNPSPKWRPKAILVVRAGIPREQLRALVRIIIARLVSRGGRQDFFEDCRGHRAVYIIEIIIIRRVQEKNNNIEPNDEYYLRGGSRGGSGGGGFSVGFGGISIGKSSKQAVIRDQWGLQRVGFSPRVNESSAWNIEDGNEKNTIVAVIDSGMDMKHPDKPRYFWTNQGEVPDNGIDDDLNGYVDDVNGWNFLDNNNDLTDIRGHGTVVVGIIAANTNNGIGVAGINPGAQIMPLKVGDEYGNTDNLDIYRAIRYAVDNGARVINMSLGEAGISKLEQLAINYAYARGCLVVVAAGNQSGDISDYGPAACRRVLAVNAMDIEGTKSVICNTGANVALMAPGEEIYSLHSQDAEWEGPSAVKERLYWRESGTSFSAPIVAATASLIWAKNSQLTNRQVEDILLDSADDLFMRGWDAESGAGLVNASKALKASPEGILTLRPTEVFVERDGRKAEAVYIFGIIRGDIDKYTVELGKDIETKKWETIAQGNAPVEYGLIAKIDGKMLKKKEFVVRITASDKSGDTKLANLPILLKEE